MIQMALKQTRRKKLPTENRDDDALHMNQTLNLTWAHQFYEFW